MLTFYVWDRKTKEWLAHPDLDTWTPTASYSLYWFHDRDEAMKAINNCKSRPKEQLLIVDEYELEEDIKQQEIAGRELTETKAITLTI